MSDPIQATDAEVSLLGAAMSGYPELDELLTAVEPSDFYAPFHEAVWAAIGRVHRTGNRPDPISVRLALAEDKVKHDPVRLLDLTQMVPSVAQAPYYAERVAEASGLRAIQAAGVRVAEIGGQVGSDLDDLRERARQAVDEATRGRHVSQARTLADVLPAVLDQAQNGRENVLGTGWPDVDRIIGGLAPGRLLIVGARPGVGKSLMGANMALHFAHHHKHAVLFSSLEMTEGEAVQRMLASHARVDLTALMDGKTSEASWERIARCTADLNAMPLTIVDAADQTVATIRRAARDVQRRRDDLALIIVDYLQLVRPMDARVNRNEQVGQISRDLKLLARETGACVVAMAQVNRDNMRRNDRPRMSDLRESGSIEADADQVILLHHPDETQPELEVIVDKNRHGPKGVAALKVQGHYAHLASVAWSPTQNLREIP